MSLSWAGIVSTDVLFYQLMPLPLPYQKRGILRGIQMGVPLSGATEHKIMIEGIFMLAIGTGLAVHTFFCFASRKLYYAIVFSLLTLIAMGVGITLIILTFTR
jgi:hypothetical protein